jgi:LysM repeat protein
MDLEEVALDCRSSINQRRGRQMKKASLGLMIAALLALVAAQLGWAMPTVQAAPSPHGHIHYVRWGENLWRIARLYGTTVEAIAAANGILNPNRIYAGQRLVIPGYPRPRPHPWHAPGGFWYRVRYGDTLSGIAWRYGRSTWSIANANGIGNPNWIYAGQLLYIP